MLIWEENRQAYGVFCFMDTQWRVGMNGPEGLDYLVLYQKLDRMKLNDDDYQQLFDDVQVMEYAHLEALHKERMKKPKPP